MWYKQHQDAQIKKATLEIYALIICFVIVTFVIVWREGNEKNDAESAITQALYEYVKTNKGKVDELVFYGWLQRERPHLLSFKCSGSQYQQASIWVKSFNSSQA